MKALTKTIGCAQGKEETGEMQIQVTITLILDKEGKRISLIGYEFYFKELNLVCTTVAYFFLNYCHKINDMM